MVFMVGVLGGTMRTMIMTVIRMARGMFELVGILGIASGRWGVGGSFSTRIPLLEHYIVLSGP